MKKRILSMILVATMVFTSVDITAFAQEFNSVELGTIIEDENLQEDGTTVPTVEVEEPIAEPTEVPEEEEEEVPTEEPSVVPSVEPTAEATMTPEVTATPEVEPSVAETEISTVVPEDEDAGEAASPDASVTPEVEVTPVIDENVSHEIAQEMDGVDADATESTYVEILCNSTKHSGETISVLAFDHLVDYSGNYFITKWNSWWNLCIVPEGATVYRVGKKNYDFKCKNRDGENLPFTNYRYNTSEADATWELYDTRYNVPGNESENYYWHSLVYNEDGTVYFDGYGDGKSASFNGHYYKAFDSIDTTWKEAKAYCESMGGYLVTITSKEENDFIHSFAEEGNGVQYWLGATDEEEEGVWKWVTGERWDYTNWKEGEPNNLETNSPIVGEDYLSVNLRVWGPAEWGDDTNDSDRWGAFICEWGDVEENIPLGTVDELVDKVNLYTSDGGKLYLREFNALIDELENSNASSSEKLRKINNFFVYRGFNSIEEGISYYQDACNAKQAYDYLLANDVYLAYQYWDYLNCTPKGNLARGLLLADHWIFNNGLMQYLDPSTYITEETVSIKNYKTLLLDFMDTTTIEYETLTYTDNMVKAMKGGVKVTEGTFQAKYIRDVQKAPTMKEKNRIFREYINNSEGIITDDKKYELHIEGYTNLSKLLKTSGTIVKVTSESLDDITNFILLETRLETINKYSDFLETIVEGKDVLPYGLVVAAEQLLNELVHPYLNQVSIIAGQLCDHITNDMYDLSGQIMGETLGGAVATIELGAWVVDQLTGIGTLVKQSAYVEAYAYLGMYYSTLLYNAKNNFNNERTIENAWKFYDTYQLLFQIRQKGEKAYLDMYKTEGVVDILVKKGEWDYFNVSDTKAFVQDTLTYMNDYCYFGLDNAAEVGSEHFHAQKIIIACPVNVEIYDESGNLIYLMRDEVEYDETNTYGRFVCKYLPMQGDFVKVAYLNNDSQYNVKIIGQKEGVVSCSIVNSSEEPELSIKGFNEIVVNEGDILQFETDETKFSIDYDGDDEDVVLVDLVDKNKLYVQFDYQDKMNITTVYVDEDGKIELPPAPQKEDFSFGGWYTKPNGGGELFDVNKELLSSITLYAYWIPNGFWIQEITDQTYTGKAIKPAVLVYDGATPLQKNKDYTVSYKNNTKPNDASKAKTAPTITVTGKGNYKGTETVTFKILKKDIGEEDITATDIKVAYNKKVQKKVPTVKRDGKKLEKDKDFTVSYPDLKENKNAYKAPGEYTILVKGKGGYTGTREVKLIITESKLMSKVTVSKIATQPYTGTAVTTATMAKAPTVKYGDKKLKEGTHYTVSYENNVNIGTATMTLTGTDTETPEGTFTGTKKVTFKIGGTSLAKAKVTGVPESMTYIGAEINEQTENWGNPIKVLLNGDELTRAADADSEGDYIVTFSKNTNKGTASVTIKGINSYSGSIKKEFVINAYNINDNTKLNLVTEEMDTNTVYAKGGSKPEPVVKFGETTLVKGKDYTLTYTNNTRWNDGTSTSKRPTVTITGKGNFKGTVKIPYTIAKQDIGNMKMSAADVVYKKEKGAYKAMPVVKDLDNKTLKNKTDYTVTSYTYGQDVTLKNGTERKEGETVGKNDIVPAGTLLKVAVTGKGNYTGDTLLVAEYRVVKSSIAKATVTVPSQPYTGKSITIEDKTKIKVKVGKTKLDPEDFEIVDGSFKNNTKAGTASFTIKGVGNYGGTKKVTFTIKKKNFIWWWRK